jgi:hypothetical protein
MSKFNTWWVRGWVIVGLLALAYEGAAFVNETWGNATLPTLSTIIVTLIPLPILDAITVIVCVVLLWHWADLQKKLTAFFQRGAVVARELVEVPPWITVERYTGTANGYWKVVDMQYFDPGNVIVYAYAEDAQGRPSLVSKAVQANGGVSLLNFELKEGRAEATFNMTGDSSFDPKRGEVGPYTLSMFGSSDKVRGIGLPLKQHVELHVTFRWMLNEVPPVVPPTDPPTGGPYVTAEEFKVYKQAMQNANA